MSEALKERFLSKSPKKVLSLDGGGIRGVLTLEFLEQIETLLGKRSSNPEEFRLCDYFDLIGGTSTGSIIAAMLSCGFSVGEIKKLYRQLADEVFQRSVLRDGLFVSKFPEKPLRKALVSYLGKETTLESDRIRTGLMIMTKRLDTGSPWPLHNCPFGPYFNPKPGSGDAIANKDFLLAQIVRASTAAPHFFKPEKIVVATNELGESVEGAFVDGGVSTANNPALQMLMLASLKGYGFNWPLGRERLLLVSIGTGEFPIRMKTKKVMKMSAIDLAIRSLMSIMHDSDALVQTLLQWMGNTKNPWLIDSEIGDLCSDKLGGHDLLTYVRYNARIDNRWLQDTTGREYNMSDEQIEELQEMDKPGNVNTLSDIGKNVAPFQVREEDFPAAFDSAR